ncbi:MAG: transposase [bacterium]|nr:transposase [bacterium]
MPKPPRIVIPGIPHHVTQRGNNHQPIFLDSDDRSEYLSILKLRSEKYGIEVQGYCLMPNHIHLAVVPLEEGSLSLAIGYSHRVYAQRFNKKYFRSGHLWESRFYSCPLDEDHFIRALIYIDRNPVRAGIVKVAETYHWSSARVHSGITDSAKLVDLSRWKIIASAYDWASLLRDEENGRQLQELRDYTYKGKSFVKTLG